MSLSRREFGHKVAVVAGASLLGGSIAAAASTDVLDEALGWIARTGPEFGGLSNHGPMAAEAMVALGRSEAVLPWLDRYRKRLQPAPTERNRMTGDEWRAALGDFTRVGDWVARFDRELLAAPWRSVLATWLPRLLPGTSAVLFHGVLRTAHAARGLSRADTAPRRHELASGLGYWAARYITLPTRASRAPAPARPSQVLPGIERVPPDRNVNGFVNAVQEVGRL